ncbi:MAG TPA: alpha/beta fold hydrolase [Polyangiaceae bacterium]|nr:alpha/beta fold hydrolase [Polyangiaceae bacterium]
MRYLLLHGFSGSPQSLAEVESVAAGSVTPTLGGHLGTPVVGGYWDEVERLAALGNGCTGLLGYSLGGRFALGILARYPQRFEHAVVISAHPGLKTDEERAARREGDARFVRLLRERGLTAFVDAWQALPLWASQGSLPEAVKQAQREQRLRHDAGGLAESLLQHGLGEMPDLRPRLREVQTPVDLVVGVRDPKFVALGEELSGVMPGSRLIRVADAGHNLLLERSELICRLVQRENVL